MSSKENSLLKRQVIFALTSFIAISLGSCSNLKKDQKNEIEKQSHWMNFEWYGDSIGKRYYDKLAITIPFSIEGIPHKFKSQFDLGATSTMVYGNSIRPYLDKYSNISEKLDTLNKTYWLQNQKVGAFKKINFKLDTVLFENQELLHFDGFGDTLTKDSVETRTIKHIGTIGANLFQHKYLVIDFPNQRIAILDSLNADYMKRTTFVDLKLDKGRIKVPVTINGTIHYFMFDTGSSLFPLSVTKEDVKLISSLNSANDTLNISTWGEFYDVHGYKITSSIFIGDYKIETQNLNVYDSKKEFKQFFENEGISGLMGNAFFTKKKIIIDYKNKKFGIVN